MNDKDLLAEDTADKTENTPKLDALPVETDSKLNNEAILTSVTSSESNEAAEAKPKRKYTRKVATKAEPGPQSDAPGEPENKSEQTKPKRSYTRKKTVKSEDAAALTDEPVPTDAESDFFVTECDPKESETVTSAAQVADLTENSSLPDLSDDGDCTYISDLLDLAGEEDLLADDTPEEASTDEELDPSERILPPDELFADRCKSAEAAEDAEDSCEDMSEEPPPIALVDEDGQYRFSELEESDSEPRQSLPSEPEEEKYNPEKPRRIDGRFDILELFVFTLLAVMIITSFFFRHSIVEGESMENTLHGGEHLIISDLFYTPKHGDIIVCEDYTTAIPKPIVKRVIAIAGDTVEIKRNGNIYINGVLLVEDYVNIDIPNYEYDELTVKLSEGELFVMGDHRNESTDSREIGTVSEDSVLGKVLLRFYPFDKFGTVK